MNRHPSVVDILTGVSDFLTRQIVPTIDDAGRRFRLRIAVHLIALAVRNIRHGDAHMLAELDGLLQLDSVRIFGSEGQGNHDLSLEERIDELNRLLAELIRDDQNILQDKAVKAHLKHTLLNELSIAQPNFDTDMNIGDDT